VFVIATQQLTLLPRSAISWPDHSTDYLVVGFID
jgi:hypothetical protein